MTLAPEVIQKLNVPLDPSRVSRFASGPQQGVNYLEGHDVIRTANDVFGYGQWGFEPVGQPWIVEAGTQGSNKTPYEVWACIGRLTVKGCEPVTEIGTNARQGTGSASLEMAIKGSITDALKRCLRMFGDQFGLILYDKDLAHQQEAIDRWHDYQRQHGGVAQRQSTGGGGTSGDGGSTPPPTNQPESAPVAHIDPTPNEPTPNLMTLRELEAELSKWRLGRAVVGAFIKGTKTPAPLSDAEFAEFVASDDGQLYETPRKLVVMSLNYIKNNVPDGPFRQTAIDAIKAIRDSQQAQQEVTA